jgi:bacteriocin biosynthesis cyclodehydratase domain-containing protein
MSRGYVSPPFLPGGGPCLRCLLDHFRRLSPMPELYAELLAHSESGGTIPAPPFPAPAAAMLVQLVRWKLELLAEPEPPAALYELHVLDVASLEITAHPVFPDPECADCGTPL